MKKGKLAIIIISGLIGVGIIGNMLDDGSKNNDIHKNQVNELPKVEQKAEKTEEQLKSEQEQKKKEEEKLEEKRQEAGQAKVASRAVQSKEPQVDPNVKEVYITPSGKRYHYDPQCGGKNSYKVGINAVKGRTPCKKCVH